MSISEKENSEAVLTEVAFWLEGDRWSRSGGAPIAEVVARVEKVRTALQRRAIHQPWLDRQGDDRSTPKSAPFDCSSASSNFDA